MMFFFSKMHLDMSHSHLFTFQSNLQEPEDLKETPLRSEKVKAAKNTPPKNVAPFAKLHLAANLRAEQALKDVWA